MVDVLSLQVRQQFKRFSCDGCVKFKPRHIGEITEVFEGLHRDLEQVGGYDANHGSKKKHHTIYRFSDSAHDELRSRTLETFKTLFSFENWDIKGFDCSSDDAIEAMQDIISKMPGELRFLHFEDEGQIKTVGTLLMEAKSAKAKASVGDDVDISEASSEAGGHLTLVAST